MICLQHTCVINYRHFNPGFSFLQDPTAAHYAFHDDPFLMPRNAANAVSISFQTLDSFPSPPLRLCYENSNWSLISITKENEVSHFLSEFSPLCISECIKPVGFLWTNPPCAHKVLSSSCPCRDLPVDTALLILVQVSAFPAELFYFSMFLVHLITPSSNSLGEVFNLLKLFTYLGYRL